MKKHLLLMLSIVLMLPMLTKAQTIYFSDGFESGFTEGWTQEYYDRSKGAWVTEAPANSQPWKTESGVDLQYPAKAVVGDGRAYFRNENGQTAGYKTRLITPVMDLSMGYQPLLRFYYAQVKWTADFDTLRVYYRQGAGTQWELLKEYPEVQKRWTFQEIDLPLAGAGYQIAFEANENLGRGIVLDEVIVRTKPQITKPHDVEFFEMRDNGVTVQWQASMDADFFEVALFDYEEDLNVNPDSIVKAVSVDTLESDFLEKRFEDLVGGRTYYVQIRSIGETENSAWCDAVAFRMKPTVYLPYKENFNIPYKSNGMADQRLDSWTWGWTPGQSVSSGDPGPVIPLWIGSEYFSYYSPDGSAAVAFVWQKTSASGAFTTTNNTMIPAGMYSYMATPEISGKGVDNFSISKCHVTFWGTVYDKTQAYAKSIIVGVMTDPEDVSTFVAVDTCTVWGYKTFRFFDVDLSSYTGDGRYIAFASNFQNAENQFYIDDVTIELAPALKNIMVDDIKVVPTTTEATISWPAVAGADGYEVLVQSFESKGDEVAITADKMVGTKKIVSNTNTLVLSELEPKSKFAVAVRAINGVDSTIYSQPKDFYTSAVMVLPKKYGFEEEEGRYIIGVSADKIYPADWMLFSNDADQPYEYTSYKHSGSRALYMSKDPGNDTWAVAPMVDNLSSVEMEFYLQAPTNAAIGSGVKVGVMTDPTDLSTFTEVASFTTLSITWQKYYVNFLEYTGAGKYIAFVWGEHPNKTTNNLIAIDDVTIRDLGNCFAPTVMVEDLTHESATLTWTKINPLYQYDIKVSTKEIAEAQLSTVKGDVLDSVAVDNPKIVLTGLDYATGYYVYIRTLCGGEDVSDWSLAVFTTTCPEKMPLPYSYGFEKEESGAIPACWTKPTWTTTTSTYPSVSTTYAHSGTKGLYMYNYTTYGSIINLPELEGNYATMRLSFWAYYSTANYKVMVGYMEDEDDPATFVVLNTFSLPVASQWTKFSMMLDKMPAGKKVALSGFTGATNYIYIDDVLVEDIQDVPPFNYRKVDAGTSWFEASWDGITSDQWQVIVASKKYAVPADSCMMDTIIGAADIIANNFVSTNSYKVENGLEALTWYYIYARSTKSKIWSMDSIQTDCEKINPLNGYTENFESYGPTVTYSLSSTTTYYSYFPNAKTPTCWIVGNAVDGTNPSNATTYTIRNYYPYIFSNGISTASPTSETNYYDKGTALTTYKYAPSGYNALKLYGYYSSTASSNHSPAWAAMPALDCTDEEMKTLIVSGKYKVASTAGYALIVGVMDDPKDLSTFTALDSLTGTGASAGDKYNMEFEIELSKYTGTGRYIAFRTSYGKTVTVYLDDISVNTMSCPNPKPSVTSITDNSALLLSGLSVENSWKYMVTGVKYNVDSLAEGKMPADSIVTIPLTTAGSDYEVVRMVSLKGLSADSTFYAYVATVCEDGSVSAWKEVSFTTLCSAVTADGYTENFDDYGTSSGTKLGCWTTGNLSPAATASYIPYPMACAKTGKNALRIYSYKSSTSNYNGAYAVSPAMDFGAGKKLQDYTLSFDAFGASSATATSQTVTNNAYDYMVMVGVTDDPMSPASFQMLDTIWLPLDVKRYSIDFSEYPEAKGKYIVLMNENITSTYTTIYAYAWIDNLKMELTPNCVAPYDVQFSAVGEDSVTVTWKGKTEQYVVALSKEAYVDSVKNDTLVAGNTKVMYQTVSGTSATFTGLEGNTRYYAYVQAICSATENSEWSYGLNSVKTECAPTVSLPFSDDFENYSAYGTSTHPDCYFTSTNYSTAGYYPYLHNTTGYNSAHSVYFYGYKSSNYYSALATPAIAVGSMDSLQVQFMLRQYTTVSTSYESTIIVGIMQDPNDLDTFYPLEKVTASGPASAWEQVSINLDDEKYKGAPFTTHKHVVLYAPVPTNTYNYAYVDNLKIRYIPTCYAPTDLAVDHIGTNSAEVHFAAAKDVDSDWQVELSKGGTVVKTISTTSTTVALTELDAATVYSVRVRTNCGDDDSEWSDPVSFQTKWIIDTYKWNFDINEQGTVSVPNKIGAAVATYALHPALTIDCSQATKNYASNTTYLPYQIANTSTLTYDYDRVFESGVDTTRALHLYTTATYDSAAVILPVITNPAGKQMSFDIRGGYMYSLTHTTAYLRGTVGTYAYPNAVLSIGLVDEACGIETFELLTTYRPSALIKNDTLRAASNYGWDHVVLPLDGEKMAGKQLCLMMEGCGTAYLHIDNLAIEASKGITTPVLTDVMAEDVRATLEWKGNGSAYNVYMIDPSKATKAPNFMPYLQDAPDSLVVKVENVTGNSYVFTNLIPNTEYCFYVEDVAAAAIDSAAALSNRKFGKTVCDARNGEGFAEDFELAAGWVRPESTGTGPKNNSLEGSGHEWMRPTSTTASDTAYQTLECWAYGLADNDMTSTTYNGYAPRVYPNTTSYKYSRSGNYCYYIYSTTTYKDMSFGALPLLNNLDLDTIEVSFWMRSTYEYAQTYSTASYRGRIASTTYLKGTSYSTKLAVGTMTDPHDMSTFVAQDTVEYTFTSADMVSGSSGTLVSEDINGNEFWQKMTVPMTGAKGKYIAFKQVGYGYLYIDDLKLQKIQTARVPRDPQLVEVGSTTATVTWKGVEPGNTYDIEFSESRSNWTGSTLIKGITGNTYTFTDLKVNGTYYWRVRQVTETLGTSDWAHIEEFTTECESMNPNGYKTSFECSDKDPYSVVPGATGTNVNTMKQNQCWSYVNQGTTQTVSSTYFPYNIANTATVGYSHSGAYACKLNAYGATYQMAIVSPEINAEIGVEGAGFDTLQVSFWACPAPHGLSGTNKDKISTASGTTYAKHIEIGTCTDPSDPETWTVLKHYVYEVEGNNLPTGTKADATNDYAFRKVTVKLNNATGPYVFIRANKTREDGTTFTYSTMYIDDLSFETLSNCEPASKLAAKDVDAHEATISWENAGAFAAVQVSSDPTFADASKMVCDTTGIADGSLALTDLEAATTYYFRVRNYCDASDAAEWSTVSYFRTIFTPLFEEKFTVDDIKSDAKGWRAAYGYANKVFAGEIALRDTTSTGLYNSWYRVQNLVMSGYAVRMLLGYNAGSTTWPISSTYTTETYQQKYWLISPAIAIEKENAQLSFDIATSYYTGALPMSAWEHWQENYDDQFMVIISEDAGKTWKRENAIVWNNETSDDPEAEHYYYGKGDYRLDAVPNKSTNVRLDLSKYQGKNICIAFYGESTVPNSIAAVHLDNVHVNYTTVKNEELTQCMYEDIDDVLGFSVNGDTVAAGVHKYERVVLSNEATANDSIYSLTATYLEAPTYDYNLTICEDAVFNWMGFNEHSEPGTYRMKLKSVVTGCDSIVNVHLTKTQAFVNSWDATICYGDSIEWNGVYYKTAGQHVQNLKSCGLYGGCDSIVTLNLTIRDRILTDMGTQYVCYGETYEFCDSTLATTGYYEKHYTAANGCDSTVSINFVVRNQDIASAINATICEGESYNFTPKYNALTAQGTYVDTLTNQFGCDSIVTLNLSINPKLTTTLTKFINEGEKVDVFGEQVGEAGVYTKTFPSVVTGCDSTVTITVVVLTEFTGIETQTVCQSELPIMWKGIECKTAGQYTFDTLTTVGTDSIITLTLTVIPTVYGGENAAICEGDTYNWNGKQYSEAGMYNDTLVSAAGCDSIATLTLTVNHPKTTTLVEYICQGDFYEFNGEKLTETCTRSLTTSSIETGCDSTVNLSLVVSQYTVNEIGASFCEGSSYLFKDKELTEAGVYADTVRNVRGCDSVITVLNLTMNPITYGTLEVEICHGGEYLFGEETLTEAGTYTRTIQNLAGCDSVITLTLTVADPLEGTEYAQFCAGGFYKYQGQEYYEAGTYRVALKNENGCDSIVTLTLEETFETHDTLYITVCAGETYKDEFFDVDEPGLYETTSVGAGGCTAYHVLYFGYYPSVMNVDTTIQVADLPYAYEDLIYYGEDTKPGVYTDEVQIVSPQGCDMTLYHVLTVEGQEEGILNASASSLTIYPSVINRGETIKVKNNFSANQLANMSISIYDVVGKRVEVSAPQSNQIEVGDFWTSGVYVVRIETEGQTFVGRVIVK